VEVCESLVKETLEDILDIISVARIENPSRIKIYTPEEWKYEVMREVFESRDNMGKLMKNLSQKAEFKPIIKDVISFAKGILKDINSMDENYVEVCQDGRWNREMERRALIDAKEFFEKELGCEVLIDPPDKVEKMKSAKPFRPAILIE